MVKKKIDPLDPQRSYELQDPKLPVIHGTAPHNGAEDRQNPHPVEEAYMLSLD